MYRLVLIIAVLMAACIADSPDVDYPFCNENDPGNGSTYWAKCNYGYMVFSDEHPCPFDTDQINLCGWEELSCEEIERQQYLGCDL